MAIAAVLLTAGNATAATKLEFTDGIAKAKSELAAQDHLAAAKQLKQSILVGRQALGMDHEDVGGAYALLGEAYAGLGQPAAARRYFEIAVTIMSPRLPPDDPRLQAAASRLRDMAQLADASSAPDVSDRWEKKGWISNNRTHVATGIKAPANIQRFRRLPDDKLAPEDRGRYIVYQTNDRPVPITVRVRIAHLPAADAKFEIFAALDQHSVVFGQQSPMVEMISMKKGRTRAHGYVTRWRKPATGDDEDLMEEIWALNWNDIELQLQARYMDFSSHTAQPQVMYVVGEFGTQLTGATLKRPPAPTADNDGAKRAPAAQSRQPSTGSGPTDDAMR